MRTHVTSAERPILIFERSSPGRHGTQIHPWGPQGEDKQNMRGSGSIPASLMRKTPLPLPEVQELEVVRHYIALRREQYGIDTGFYPLGSCTMKYNPKACEALGYHARFAAVHPSQPQETTQGLLHLLHDIQEWLADVSGMD